MMAKDIKSPFQGNKEDKLPKDPRFSEKDLELLHKLDEETLRMFRCVFYQDELTDPQLDKLKSVLTPDLVKVISRFFIHDLNWEEPLFGMPNRWGNPKYDALLLAEVPVVVAGRQMAIRFLENGVKRLDEIASSGRAACLDLEFDIRMKDKLVGTDSEIKAKVVAMQDAIAFLETALQSIHIFIMNPDEFNSMMERLKKNSSK